jgi:hypothetical protein
MATEFYEYKTILKVRHWTISHIISLKTMVVLLVGYNGSWSTGKSVPLIHSNSDKFDSVSNITACNWY